MKKLEKMLLVVGVLILGLILMSSSADAKKKRKTIDLSKYFTIKVDYEGEPDIVITKYKKNSKFKYKGKRVRKKDFIRSDGNFDVSYSKVLIDQDWQYFNQKGKRVSYDKLKLNPGKYTCKITLKTKDKKRYLVKKKFTIEECVASSHVSFRVAYYSDHWLEPEFFKTDYFKIQYPYYLNFNSRITVKCNYTPSELKIIDFDEYNSAISYCKKYQAYFKKQNIESNEDLRNFIYNKTKDLGEISFSKAFDMKKNHIPEIEMSVKKQNPELYNEINNRFEDEMFWRLVKPYITIETISTKTGKPLTRGGSILKTQFVYETPGSSGNCTKSWSVKMDKNDKYILFLPWHNKIYV